MHRKNYRFKFMNDLLNIYKTILGLSNVYLLPDVINRKFKTGDTMSRSYMYTKYNIIKI